MTVLNLEIVQLQKDQLNRLFPYHLLIDRPLMIAHCSSKLKQTCPYIAHQYLYDYFQFISPQTAIFDFDELVNHCGESFTIGNSSIHLTGHFEYLQTTDQLLFSGTREKFDYIVSSKSEEAILSGEERYRSIMENMNLGMVELDTESTIVFANDNLCKMSGYEMDELLGQKLYNVFSSGQNRYFIRQKLYLKEKGVSEVYEFVTKNKRGEARWWLVSGSPLHTISGEFKGSLIICLDITQQKSFEQELSKAKQQAEQSARAKDVFLANMSHEIRTPMNAILGMGKQMERTVMDGQQQFYLSAINSAAANLLVIINDVLDFSKIEAGKMSLENIGFEMEAIVNKALQLISHKAEGKGLQLSAVIDPDIAPVLIGDPHRINQVLINLLSNSVKFTEKGSLDIHCSVTEDDNTRQIIQIEVKDTGIGMSEDFQKYLFDKFMQEDDKDGKMYSGTGLGMSIVKELVELMNGTINVESKKNIGTTIHITIPFIKGTKTDLPRREEKKPNTNILFNKRILLVEDNEMNRIVATMILNQYNAIVDEAINGEEAIEAMRHNRYDLILMDMRMPVMDGLKATRLIRQNLSATVPIIALTANAVMGEQQKCREAGMDDFLAKPFEEEDLLHIITKWLGIKNVFSRLSDKNQDKQILEPLFNIDNLKSISRGNTDFITKMLSIFVKEVHLALQEIKTGESSNDIEKIRSTAHRIKPSLGNMSVHAIKNEIAQLEVFDLSGKSTDELPDLTNKVELVLNTVITQVNELIRSGEYV